jgi:hypothetical protein
LRLVDLTQRNGHSAALNGQVTPQSIDIPQKCA